MKNNILLEIKATITTLFAAFTAWLGILAVPIYILVLLNIADSWTGANAAPSRGEQRSSARFMLGIKKKVSMWLLVGIGVAIDWVLMYVAQTMGIAVPIKCFIGAAVAIWLICNEIISIMENIIDIGVKVPPFIRPLMDWVKRAAEEQTTIDKKEDAKNG